MSSYSDIFEAVEEGTVNDVKYFIEKRGIKVNARDGCGNTPLLVAIINDNQWMVKYLLSQKDVDVNAENNSGETPLHHVVRDRQGNLELLDILISAGAKDKVDARDNEGMTPLNLAAQFCKNVKVLECLISAGAKVNAKDNSGWTPLHHAVMFNSLEVVEYLISKGADVLAKTDEGQTMLQCADDIHAMYDTDEKKRILQKAIDQEGAKSCVGCLIIIAVVIGIFVLLTNL